ncbi:MAG: hypothetical protein PHR44_06850 [Candidatus Omnitrophica bacterium]|nr:hypothetical protein [Candidatus Omnitrophota bacterium]
MPKLAPSKKDDAIIENRALQLNKGYLLRYFNVMDKNFMIIS